MAIISLVIGVTIIAPGGTIQFSLIGFYSWSNEFKFCNYAKQSIVSSRCYTHDIVIFRAVSALCD